MLNVHNVRNLLLQVRGFYKGQLKSGNKMYRNPQTPRTQTRNWNSDIADSEIARHRFQLLRLRYEQYGQYLITNQVRAGNCAEMTAVAAYLVDTQYPGLDFEAVGPRNLDHVFLLIADDGSVVPPDNDRGLTLDAIARGAYGQDLWVIDPWLNLGCEAVNYSARAFAKLAGWNQQGKVIATEQIMGPGGIPWPAESYNHQHWWQRLVSEPLKYLS